MRSGPAVLHIRPQFICMKNGVFAHVVKEDNNKEKFHIEKQSFYVEFLLFNILVRGRFCITHIPIRSIRFFFCKKCFCPNLKRNGYCFIIGLWYIMSIFSCLCTCLTHFFLGFPQIHFHSTKSNDTP